MQEFFRKSVKACTNTVYEFKREISSLIMVQVLEVQIMGIRNTQTKVLASKLVLIGVLGFSIFAIAGSLEPSAPPGPTMKTLAEIEPGTPISSAPYTIAESGSYYLCANVQTTSSMFNGISIYANNVTLDLKGFSLIGDGTAGRHGVVIEGDYKNITIRNGTITNWGGSGVEGATATKCRAEDLRVIDNAGSGIRLPGYEQRVSNCMASDNGDSALTAIYGICVGDASTVTGNTANGNGTGATGSHVFGIYIGQGSTVTGNTVYDNGHSDTAEYVYGIYLFGYSLVDQNTVCNNGIGADWAENMSLNVTGCVYGNNVAP